MSLSARIDAFRAATPALLAANPMYADAPIGVGACARAARGTSARVAARCAALAEQLWRALAHCHRSTTARDNFSALALALSPPLPLALALSPAG